ncbi:DUF4386 domain-containing protein [Kribbella sp. NPDC051952]|uniref:DUF4386 domain-containing protein n=1 Tax=Kribbella sp. NPDC051952 TaxID=3154851 RepID=UPI00342D55C1
METVQLPEVRERTAVEDIRPWAVTAGAGLLLMSALAGFANFGVVEQLKTAADIAASEGLFRAGIAGLFGVIVLDIVVAVALYRFFSPVSKNLSLLAATFRLVYAAVFMVALGHLLAVLRLLGDPQAVLHELDAFSDVWLTGLGLFGCHLVLIGYLAYRSGYVPRLLGALLVIAGLGYVADAVGTISGHNLVIANFTFLGEFLLALWLVVRGGRVRTEQSRVRSRPGRES